MKSFICISLAFRCQKESEAKEVCRYAMRHVLPQNPILDPGGPTGPAQGRRAATWNLFHLGKYNSNGKKKRKTETKIKKKEQKKSSKLILHRFFAVATFQLPLAPSHSAHFSTYKQLKWICILHTHTHTLTQPHTHTTTTTATRTKKSKTLPTNFDFGYCYSLTLLPLLFLVFLLFCYSFLVGAFFFNRMCTLCLPIEI